VPCPGESFGGTSVDAFKSAFSSDCRSVRA